MTFTLGLVIGVIIGWILQTHSPPNVVNMVNGCITQSGKFLGNAVSSFFSSKPKTLSSSAQSTPKSPASPAKAPPGTTSKKPSSAAKVASIATPNKKLSDDLKRIEGIGPKIAELLQQDGISSFADLTKATQDRLKSILDKGGARYRFADPSSWAEQATIANSGNWDKLKQFQQKLKGDRQTN